MQVLCNMPICFPPFFSLLYFFSSSIFEEVQKKIVKSSTTGSSSTPINTQLRLFIGWIQVLTCIETSPLRKDQLIKSPITHLHWLKLGFGLGLVFVLLLPFFCVCFLFACLFFEMFFFALCSLFCSLICLFYLPCFVLFYIFVLLLSLYIHGNIAREQEVMGKEVLIKCDMTCWIQTRFSLQVEMFYFFLLIIILIWHAFKAPKLLNSVYSLLLVLLVLF